MPFSPDPPPDVPPERFFHSAACDAARRATAWPIATAWLTAWAKRRREPPPEPLQLTTSDVYAATGNWWRWRVHQLSKVGWSATRSKGRPGCRGGPSDINDPVARQCRYLMTCPPLGLKPDGRTLRPCKRARICPWCYGRRLVLPVFEAVAEVCVDGSAAAGLAGDSVLVACERRFEVKPTATACELVHASAKDRYAELELLGADTAIAAPVATATVTWIAPPPTQRDGPGWEARRLLLVLVTDGAAAEAVRTTLTRGARGAVMSAAPCRGMTRAGLSRWFGRLLRFPDGLIFGPAEQVAGLLNELTEAESRQYTLSGAFRAKARRRVADEEPALEAEAGVVEVDDPFAEPQEEHEDDGN